MGWRAVMAAGADLAWGGACAACGRPGPVLCPDCARTLHELLPFEVPGRAGVPVTVARGDYADDVRRVILACKERQGLTLVPVLAELAVGSAALLLERRWDGRPLHLVPVPSARATVAARGFDLTAMMAARVARTLRRHRLDALVWPALRQLRPGRDQAGLDVAQRAANRRASMSVRARAPRTVLLVDDIITTGATLREASRALQQAGHTVLGAAVVAATPRTGAHT